MPTTNNIITQLREGKLRAIRNKLEEEFSLRDALVTVGSLLGRKIGYLPHFTQKEQALLKRIIHQFGVHKILEALEFALTKPEVYFQYYGREVISFMSFYHNLPFILQNKPEQKEESPPSLFGEEKERTPPLSPFMQGVLHKMKNILEGKNNNNNG